MDKPIKPIETLAEEFGGLKENFTQDKIETGYQPDVSDILAGANLNYLLDTLGKKFKYNDAISDYLKDMPIGNVPYVDNNNKLTYTSDVSFKSKDETILGAKTFTQPAKIQSGVGTGSLIIGGDVNAGTLTNGARKLARVAVPTQTNIDLTAILLSFDSSGDADLNITNKSYDNIAFGGSKKITNATSPMSISFCVATERNAKEASKKRYPLEMDAYEARFNVQPKYNGIDLATIDKIPTYTAGDNIKIEDNVISASGLPIGFILWGAYSDGYVPENTLKTDGTEFSGAEGQMFNELYTKKLVTGELDTCTYAEYETELTMTGSCWKWAVDTANEKFRIPFIPDKVLVDVDDTIGVKGNDLAIGLTNGTNNYAITGSNSTGFVGSTADYGKPYGTGTASGGTADLGRTNAYGLVPDVSKSGIEADAASAKTYKTIRHYVVVATGSINQSEADWSEFASSLQGKANVRLDNVIPSAGFRRDSVRWGKIDYSQKVEITMTPNADTTYIAVQDGLIWGQQWIGTTRRTITINGVQVSSNATNTGTSSESFNFELQQGDIFVISNAANFNNNVYCYFAPNKE